MTTASCRRALTRSTRRTDVIPTEADGNRNAAERIVQIVMHSGPEQGITEQIKGSSMGLQLGYVTLSSTLYLKR